MRRLTAVFAVLGVVGAACGTQAQNKLFNGNLELTPADVYYDGFDPSLADDVPGWEMFLGAADGSWVFVNGVGGGNVDVDMGPGPDGGGLMTAPSSRPSVIAGNTYTASVTFDNYFGASGASYFIDWFESDGDPLGSDGGLLADANGPFGYAPYNQRIDISAVAPPGAGLAGVRFISGNPGYNGLAADNFSLVPEPSSVALLALAALGLWGRNRKRR